MQKQHTLIENLPELEDNSNSYASYDKNITKFIRKQMPNPSHQSGMSGSSPKLNVPHPPAPPPDFYQDVYDQQINKLPVTLYCLDVHSHIQTCPICSRFFKHDNSIYIIAIIVLSIICIILFKKILNL
jgi:hypothetical protein